LRDRRNNFRSFIYGQSSANPANFVKCPVDVEMIGLTEISKNIFLNKTSAKHKPSSPGFAQSGWATYAT